MREKQEMKRKSAGGQRNQKKYEAKQKERSGEVERTGLS